MRVVLLCPDKRMFELMCFTFFLFDFHLQCRELYLSVKDAMHKAASRNIGTVPGLALHK